MSILSLLKVIQLAATDASVLSAQIDGYQREMDVDNNVCLVVEGSTLREALLNDNRMPFIRLATSCVTVCGSVSIH